MGMYTEVYVNVDLKEDVPADVIETLKHMINLEDVDDRYPDRWSYMFNSGSYYTPYTSCASLTFDRIGNQYSLLGKGDIKNYGGEIEAFFEWIKPFVDGYVGDFIGYSRYEDAVEPTLIYL